MSVFRFKQNDLSKYFVEAVSQIPKEQRDGYVTDTSNHSPIGASTPIGSYTMPLLLSKGDKSYIVKIH